MRKGAAGRLKGAGLRPGMPDILVFSDGGAVGIELKTERGKLSKTQIDTWDKLQAAGIRVYLSRSLEEVYRTLIIEDIPKRKVHFDGIAQTEISRPPQSDAGAA